MGTLTGDCPALDSQCPHKLATSCRLTSTQNCCACADERAHTRTYSVYIDGVGFVQRGTRWQSYCWFCKEFWTNRLAATDPPLEPSQTRIPHIPDQTEFLDRWFEFHRGYRVVKYEDGTETCIAVIGEPWREVSPGFLPRTLNELRTGASNDAARTANRFRRRRLSSEGEQMSQEEHQSLDDALDALLLEASDDETHNQDDAPSVDIAELPGDMPPSPDVAQSTNQTVPVTAATQRARERFARIFGTREEVEQDDYVSPLTSMYGRAWNRHQRAEQLRASGNTEAPNLTTLSAAERREIEQQIMWGVMQESRDANPTAESGDSQGSGGDNRGWNQRSLRETLIALSSTNNPDHMGESSNAASATIAPVSGSRPRQSPLFSSQSELRYALDQMREEVSRLESATAAVTSAVAVGRLLDAQGRNRRQEPELDMDKQDRPAPLEDTEMTKVLACQVCYSQLADIALLPCGHMIMCRWCADTVIPVKHSHVPIRTTKCPMCKKIVKQRFKIHM